MEQNFHHSGGSISVEGSSAEKDGGAVLWRAPLELLGAPLDVCGDCSRLETLLGSGKRLVEFWRFEVSRCLVSFPFRPDGIDILDILASGVPADFGNQVDLPSSRRCDLRQSKLRSVRWKPCRDELVGARVWRCHVPGLHAGPRTALGCG